MRVILIFVCCLPAFAARADLAATVNAAADRHTAVSLAGWRFARVTATDNFVSREHCVGIDTRSARCELAAIDERAPTGKELKRYAKEQQQPVVENLPNADPRSWIDTGTLERLDEQADTLEVSFRAPTEDGATWESEGAMSGNATIDTDDGFVRALAARNTVRFKPATGVTVKELATSADFALIGDTVFAVHVTMRIDGKAFGLKRIRQESAYTFDDFEFNTAAGE